MDPVKQMEEKLLEVACLGDMDTVQQLVLEKKVDVNAQHAINGWSALHWAAKRGHTKIVTFLLENGADTSLTNSKEETPVDLTDNSTIRRLLGGDPNSKASGANDNLPITPNYLANPPFPYASPQGDGPIQTKVVQQNSEPYMNGLATKTPSEDELVLKARVANVLDTDFIEIELPRSHLSFEALLFTMCKELQVDRRNVMKIRKLPDTVLRKDKDIFRLKDFQEVELVLTTKATSQASRNYGLAPQPINIDVVY